MDIHYNVLVAAAYLIPATADLTGLPEEVIQKHWDAAQKKNDLCTFRVEGDLPATKRCGHCSTLLRREVSRCVTCTKLFR